MPKVYNCKRNLSRTSYATELAQLVLGEVYSEDSARFQYFLKGYMLLSTEMIKETLRAMKEARV